MLATGGSGSLGKRGASHIKFVCLDATGGAKALQDSSPDVDISLQQLSTII